MNRYYNPVQTVEGPGCAGELAALLREMALEEGRVLLLVWNEDVLKLPTFMELADAGFMVCSLVFRASNPTVEQLFETYQATRELWAAGASWMWASLCAACTAQTCPTLTACGG